MDSQESTNIGNFNFNLNSDLFNSFSNRGAYPMRNPNEPYSTKTGEGAAAAQYFSSRRGIEGRLSGMDDRAAYASRASLNM